jgi:hypothetical protein
MCCWMCCSVQSFVDEGEKEEDGEEGGFIYYRNLRTFIGGWNGLLFKLFRLSRNSL